MGSILTFFPAPLAVEYFRLLGLYFGYIAILAAILIAIRFTTRVPDYIFRKLLHTVAFTSILPLVLCTDDWRAAVLVEGTFLVLIILALHAVEGLPFYKHLLVEKSNHEVITSFTILFSLMTLLLALFWGLFGDSHKYICVTAIMAWGPGDAAAAIVGRNLGRHKLSGPHIEGIKSIEGTVAMGICSFLCTLGSLLSMSGLPPMACLVLSFIIAPIAALVELFTKRGLDTVTVPIAAGGILFIAMLILG